MLIIPRAIKSEQIDTVIDKDRWDQRAMATAQVNAFYEPDESSVDIMAGIFSGKIYNEDMCYEQILGGIGAVIG